MSKGVAKTPFSTITLNAQIRWKDVRNLVFEVIEYGNISEWDVKKLAQKSLLLLGKKQEKSKMNLSYYSTVISSLDFLSDDEIRRLALQCISRCTDSVDNCHNITSIAQKVGVINTRYFDYKFRGKPYSPNKPTTTTEKDVGVVGLGKVEAEVDGMDTESVDGVFDISKALGYIPFSD